MKTLGSIWPALAFFAFLAAIGFVLDSFWQSLLTLVFFYAFMGMTWNLMMTAGLLSLGHALFLGLGAYSTAVLSQTYGWSPWLAIAGGAILSSIIGMAITWIGVRYSVKGVHFALLTIAFAEFTRVVFDNWGLVGGTGGYFLKAINYRNQQSSRKPAGRHPLFLSCLPCHHCGRLRGRRIPDEFTLGLSLARTARR